MIKANSNLFLLQDGVADNPPPITAMQIKTTKPKIESGLCGATNLINRTLRTKNFYRNNQAKNIKTAKCEKAVGLIGWLYFYSRDSRF